MSNNNHLIRTMQDDIKDAKQERRAKGALGFLFAKNSQQDNRINFNDIPENPNSSVSYTASEVNRELNPYCNPMPVVAPSKNLMVDSVEAKQYKNDAGHVARLEEVMIPISDTVVSTDSSAVERSATDDIVNTAVNTGYVAPLENKNTVTDNELTNLTQRLRGSMEGQLKTDSSLSDNIKQENTSNSEPSFMELESLVGRLSAHLQNESANITSDTFDQLMDNTHIDNNATPNDTTPEVVTDSVVNNETISAEPSLEVVDNNLDSDKNLQQVNIADNLVISSDLLNSPTSDTVSDSNASFSELEGLVSEISAHLSNDSQVTADTSDQLAEQIIHEDNTKVEVDDSLNSEINLALNTSLPVWSNETTEKVLSQQNSDTFVGLEEGQVVDLNVASDSISNINNEMASVAEPTATPEMVTNNFMNTEDTDLTTSQMSGVSDLPLAMQIEEEKIQSGGVIEQQPVADTQISDAMILERLSVGSNQVSGQKEDFWQDKYVSPENRLILGKQEYYSSIYKKIKEKNKQDNLDRFKHVLESGAEAAVLTEAEEKQQLKQHIVKKYRLNLHAMPWKKIIVGAVLFLTIWTVFLFALPRTKPVPVETPPKPVGSEIVFVQDQVKSKVDATEVEVASINYFDATIYPWSMFDDKSITRLNIVSSEDKSVLVKKEAMNILLQKENADNIPQEFMENTDDAYNILVFKNQGNLRLGLVFSFSEDKLSTMKDVMSNWEKVGYRSQFMHVVMKNLFVKTRTVETSHNFNFFYNSSSYKGASVRYLNLPDTKTSLDYIFYKNYLIFTTSKETAEQIIDTLSGTYSEKSVAYPPVIIEDVVLPPTHVEIEDPVSPSVDMEFE